VDDNIIIAGGGIGGLCQALTLHQIGVSCIILESAKEMRSVGVGLNLQPNAVRELMDLGISLNDLETVGSSVQEWALLGLNGCEVYAEARGTRAGYHWPQFAVHRGDFHMLLYRKVLERLGAGAIHLGVKVTGYSQNKYGVVVTARGSRSEPIEIRGRLLLGADGIHSAVRAEMYPKQPPIHWGGAIMWRGTARAKPIRTASSFVGLGTNTRRLVLYPISGVDRDGTALINWIAEVTVDSSGGWQQAGWFKSARIDDFIEHFNSFKFDWLNVPDMLRQADCAYENPMIDRDPVDSWVNGNVALLGDAAHAMYPTGSNGASQAIVDGRVIGASILEHGVSADALCAYDKKLCAKVSLLVLRNREAGPFGLLNILDERCGGVFDEIESVIPWAERQEFMAEYKEAAGFAMEALNTAASTISLEI